MNYHCFIIQLKLSSENSGETGNRREDDRNVSGVKVRLKKHPFVMTRESYFSMRLNGGLPKNRIGVGMMISSKDVRVRLVFV
jgi:hypothetical protein